MSKEMLELADEIEKLARLDAQAGVGSLCAHNAAIIVLALRASAVAEPAAWRTRNADKTLWLLWPFRPRYADDSGIVCEPLYAHPAPAAPVPDQCAKCGQPHKEHTYNGACYGVCGEFVSATASLPAPEAAPTREEIAAWFDCQIEDTSRRQKNAYAAGCDNQGERLYSRHIAFVDAKIAILALFAAKAAPHA